MNLRTVVLICAAAGIPLALIALLMPITWGYGGYQYTPSAKYATVYYSDPSGPAYAAGVRVGQRILPNRGDEYVREDAGPVGTTVREHVVGTDGRIRILSFAFVPFTGSLGFQQQIDKLVNALTALGAFIIAILVLLRARNQRVGVRAASVLFFSGAAALSLSGSLVCGNAWLAEILSKFLPLPLAAAAYWSQLALLAIYPPNRTKLRNALSWFGAVQFALVIASDYRLAYFIATGTTAPFFAAIAFGVQLRVASLVFAAVIAAGIFDAFASAGDEDRTAVRWLGVMWLIAAAFAVAPAIEGLSGRTLLQTHYGDFIRSGIVLFSAFGVAYPVLRHRLVDLNALVSRATVFTVVSMIIVAAFVAAEWGIAKIFEQSVGLSHERSGLAAQLLSLVIVLALGMSARSIHRFVEQRLTRAFFRKRLQGLADIQRVAREADAATDAGDLMDLAVHTVARALDPLGVAFYLHLGGHYELRGGAGGPSFVPSYRFNDAVPLRLRRWQEPFELDDESDDRFHMLFVPMAVRGDLIGFLCCGPKPDRTAYLAGETQALSLLAHHVAIATALLPRSAPE